MGSATVLIPIQGLMFAQAWFYLYHWRLYISKSQYKKLIKQYFILNNTFFEVTYGNVTQRCIHQ